MWIGIIAPFRGFIISEGAEVLDIALDALDGLKAFGKMISGY